jgi:hypothetical protein
LGAANDPEMIYAMSALGQKRTKRHVGPVSALPPERHVRFSPKSEHCWRQRGPNLFGYDYVPLQRHMANLLGHFSDRLISFLILVTIGGTISVTKSWPMAAAF